MALRNVAVAAMLVLLVSPQSLVDVGFQMSFAAVVALISGLEALERWRQSRPAGVRTRHRGAGASALAFLAGIVATTLIATVAVAPFAAYYFHKSTQYGVLANLAAIPVCNILVMPAALATLIAMPFGLEAWPLALMGLGIDVMGWIAQRVAALPGAVLTLPEVSATAFALMVGGGIWLALWQTSWRLLGLLPVLAGLALAPLRQAPDVLVAQSAALLVVWTGDGEPTCASGATVLSALRLARDGAHAIRIEVAGNGAPRLAIMTVRSWRGERPWSKPRADVSFPRRYDRLRSNPSETTDRAPPSRPGERHDGPAGETREEPQR
jgi:competence protein ComEC